MSFKRPRKPLTIPSAGIIKGGRLNGWHYHFLRFRARPRGLRVVARCTPPAWPFPHDIAMDASHFVRLTRVPGGRAKTLDADALIARAYELEKLVAPAWIAATTVTLYALIKRANPPRKTKP